MMSEHVDGPSIPGKIRNPEVQRRLCVFARAPVLGQVKSRLAVTIGEPATLDAHIRLVEHTLMQVCGRASREGVRQDAACSTPEHRELWIAGDINHPLVRRWGKAFKFTLHVQCDGDLGARMRYALNASPGSVASVLIGSDCPGIDVNYLEAAFEALEDADVVLGPSEDGGYGLIGARQDLPGLFDSISWGTSKVLAETRARCRQLGLRCTLLPLIWDVDTEVDWRRFLASF